MFLTHFVPMKTPKCYTWLESCGSHLSGGIKEKIFFSILQSVRFSRTLRTDIFLYTEKLSYLLLIMKYHRNFTCPCFLVNQNTFIILVTRPTLPSIGSSSYEEEQGGVEQQHPGAGLHSHCLQPCLELLPYLSQLLTSLKVLFFGLGP